MVRLMVYVLVLCWCALTNSLWAGDMALSLTEKAQALAAKVQALYEETGSFTADFEQEVLWRRGGTVRLSRGKVWFKKPGLMRWEYRWPESFLIVADGKEVYLYTPEDKQVMIFPSGKVLSPKVTLGFINGRGNLLRDFTIMGYEDLEKGLAALELHPKVENPQVERLRLVVKKANGLITEIWFWDYLGNLTKIRFLRLRRNVAIEDDIFRFKPPKGVEIIREE